MMWLELRSYVSSNESLTCCSVTMTELCTVNVRTGVICVEKRDQMMPVAVTASCCG